MICSLNSFGNYTPIPCLTICSLNSLLCSVQRILSPDRPLIRAEAAAILLRHLSASSISLCGQQQASAVCTNCMQHTHTCTHTHTQAYKHSPTHLHAQTHNNLKMNFIFQKLFSLIPCRKFGSSLTWARLQPQEHHYTHSYQRVKYHLSPDMAAGAWDF